MKLIFYICEKQIKACFPQIHFLLLKYLELCLSKKKNKKIILYFGLLKCIYIFCNAIL